MGRTNRCMFRTTDRTGFFRSFPNIFGITTTAELQECGALGRPRPRSFNKNVTTVRWLRLRFFPYLCLEPWNGPEGFEKGTRSRDLSWWETVSWRWVPQATKLVKHLAESWITQSCLQKFSAPLQIRHIHCHTTKSILWECTAWEKYQW